MTNRKPAIVYGYGINDHSVRANINRGVKCKQYRLWNDMLKRCYDQKYITIKPTYADFEVDDRWKYYHLFYDDITSMVNFDKAVNDGWVLDKDILTDGRKVYSRETCCFVPAEINVMFRELTKKDKAHGMPVGVVRQYCGANYEGFTANASLGGKKFTLGCFDTKGEAFKAYVNSKNHYFGHFAKIYDGVLDTRVVARLKSISEGKENFIYE